LAALCGAPGASSASTGLIGLPACVPHAEYGNQGSTYREVKETDSGAEGAQPAGPNRIATSGGGSCKAVSSHRTPRLPREQQGLSLGSAILLHFQRFWPFFSRFSGTRQWAWRWRRGTGGQWSVAGCRLSVVRSISTMAMSGTPAGGLADPFASWLPRCCAFDVHGLCASVVRCSAFDVHESKMMCIWCALMCSRCEYCHCVHHTIFRKDGIGGQLPVVGCRQGGQPTPI
jgi:hypothetical protein